MTTPSPITPGLVAIIITSYNRSHYLRQALESVLAQTYTNYHIIIVDDASSDNSATVARDYQARYPEQITALCKETRLGLVDSVNQAFAHCHNAAYIAFHPDDDLWRPDKLEKQIVYFTQHPQVGIVCSNALLIDATGQPTGQSFAERSGSFDDQNITRRIFLSANFICAASVVVSHEALAYLGFRIPLPFHFMNDEYMWMVMSSAFAVHCIEEPLTRYRLSSGSVSATYLSRIHQEEWEIRFFAYERWPHVRRLITTQEVEDQLLIRAYQAAAAAFRARRWRAYRWFVRRAWQFRPRPATARLMMAATLSAVAPQLVATIRKWRRS